MNRILPKTLLSFATAVLACAQQSGTGLQQFVTLEPVQQQQPQQLPTHAVTGTIVNSVTGEPINRALVTFQGPSPAQMLTGPDGRFHFEGAPEGQFILLQATRPGYSEETKLPHLRHKVDSQNNDFQLKLVPNARIVGHITNENGEGLEGATLMLLAKQINGGRKIWQPSGSALVDDEDGRFEIDNLQPGTYRAYCSGLEAPREQLNGPAQVYPPMYFPESKDASGAVEIDLQPGSESTVDFHLPREQGYRVTGQVTGIGSESRGAGMMLWTESGQVAQFARLNLDRKTGQFTIDAVPSGSWEIRATSFEGRESSIQTTQELTVGHSDIRGLVLPLQPNPTVPVVVNGDEKGLQQVWLSSSTGRQPSGRFAGRDTPSSQFEFKNIPAGKYTLAVRTTGDQCLQSATYGGVDLVRNELVLDASSSSVQPIMLSLTTNCGVLQPTVKGADEQQMAYIIVAPDAGGGNPIVQPVPVGSNALQSRAALPPGTYQVFAFAEINDLEYTNSEVMRSYHGQSVTLDAGASKELSLDLADKKDR